MEDAMMISKIVRAPQRRVYYLDVGNLPPDKVDEHIKRQMNSIKKTPFIDPQTGQYNLKYNVQNLLEDYVFAVRGNHDGTRIETLPGLQYQNIETVQYFRNKMISSLRIPKPFIGYQQAMGTRSNLASQDLHFAKTIEKLQRVVVQQLEKMAFIHLFSQGYQNQSLTNFQLSLTNPSILYEQEKMQLWQTRVGLIRDIRDLRMISDDYIYTNFLQFSQGQATQMRQGIMRDMKRNYLYEKMYNEGSIEQQAQMGDQMGGMGQLDFGGGMEDMPADMGGGQEMQAQPNTGQLQDVNKQLRKSPQIDQKYKSPQKNQQLRLGNQGNPSGVRQMSKQRGFDASDDLFGMGQLKQKYGRKHQSVQQPKRKRQIITLTQ